MLIVNPAHPSGRVVNSHLDDSPAALTKYAARQIAYYANQIAGDLGNEPVPKWIAMKAALIVSNVSDVAHYLRDKAGRRPNGSSQGYMTPYAIWLAGQYAEAIAAMPDDVEVSDWAQFKLVRAAGWIDDIAHYVEYMRARGMPLVHHADSAVMSPDVTPFELPETMVVEVVELEPVGEGGFGVAADAALEARVANACGSCRMLTVRGSARSPNSCYPGLTVFLDNMPAAMAARAGAPGVRRNNASSRYCCFDGSVVKCDQPGLDPLHGLRGVQLGTGPNGYARVRLSDGNVYKMPSCQGFRGTLNKSKSSRSTSPKRRQTRGIKGFARSLGR